MIIAKAWPEEAVQATLSLKYYPSILLALSVLFKVQRQRSNGWLRRGLFFLPSVHQMPSFLCNPFVGKNRNLNFWARSRIRTDFWNLSSCHVHLNHENTRNDKNVFRKLPDRRYFCCSGQLEINIYVLRLNILLQWQITRYLPHYLWSVIFLDIDGRFWCTDDCRGACRLICVPNFLHFSIH